MASLEELRSLDIGVSLIEVPTITPSAHDGCETSTSNNDAQHNVDVVGFFANPGLG